MIASLIGTTLLRRIPDRLAAGVASGDYQVYGSIIRSLSSGRIVGHLQEAGGLSKLASLISTGPLAPLKVATGVVGLVQKEQIKGGIARLEAGVASLEQLGIANLALGAAGIGISVAGFAVISRNIDGLKRAVEGLGDRVDAIGVKVEALREDVIAGELDDLRGLAKLMDEGWRDGGTLGERRWHKVAEDVPRLAARFERRSGQMLGAGAIAVEAAQPMLDALNLATSLRVAGLAAAGEARAACAAATEGAETIEMLTGRIGLADLARARLASWRVTAGTSEWGHALGRAVEEARAEVCRLRDREAAAATRTAPLATLEARGIDWRDWLAAARAEQEAPVLVMMGD
jgi:outer membrane murein-binding lipoprotein Lpp